MNVSKKLRRKENTNLLGVFMYVPSIYTWYPT